MSGTRYSYGNYDQMGHLIWTDRRSYLLRAAKLVSTLGAALVFQQPALAQSSSPEPMPADSLTISPGEVSVREGRYRPSKVQLDIGGDSPGFLRLAGKGDALNISNDKSSRINGWLDRVLNGRVSTSKNCPLCPLYRLSAKAGDTSISWNLLGQPNLESGSTYAELTLTTVATDTWSVKVTLADGSVFNYQNISSVGATSDNNETAGAVLSSISPDGVRYDYTYTSSGNLVKVASNTGYAMLFAFNDAANPKSYTSACVVNTARTYVAATTCPAGVQSVSTAYSTNTRTTTERDGTVWVRQKTPPDSNGNYQEKWFKPGDSVPYVVNNIGPTGLIPLDIPKVLSQDFADGRHFQYLYEIATVGYTPAPPPDQGVEPKEKAMGYGWIETNPAAPGVSLTTTLVFEEPVNIVTPTPLQVTDPLNRVSKWIYPTNAQGAITSNVLHGRELPEGNKELYTHDAFRNIISVTEKAKPGSGLPDVVSTATFANCTNFANLIACNKPTQTVDAKGNVSDFTYSSVHGGVLTETGPADVNGIRPVKRHAYAQRYAWLKKATTGYAKAATPIWVKTEERTCRTTATVGNACAGGAADEVVTTYDYGPDSGPNNLWLRGVAITADGETLRTCFSYDEYGRKLGETKPLGTGASCP